MGDLRYFVSRRGGEMAGIARRRDRAAVACRRQGEFLYRSERHVDGGSGQWRDNFCHGSPRAFVSDSWTRSNFLDRRFYLRRGERREALSGESLRKTGARAAVDHPAEHYGG